jgi:ATP-dependent RNA helicase RhlE
LQYTVGIVKGSNPLADEQLEQAVQVQEAETQDPTFNDYPFSDSIFQDIRAAGFERPTPIQAKCIPVALEGRDLIGLAQTGTGKTAAFALPIIQKLAARTELAALILVPTRELANQVTSMFNQLGASSGIRVATIVGGVPMENDYRALRSWPNILVATPGRLIDHLTYRSVSLREIEILVVDEADRMHDMGFIPQIRRILSELPPNRQTMMFTATMPPDVERIARMSMKDPVRIQVGFRSAPAAGAKQQLFAVNDAEKKPLLMKLLHDRDRDSRVLIFVRTKRGVDKLHRVVVRRFNAARIHGDREQADRDEAMRGFREGRYPILIATDIAARGIDVADIEQVINYDFPLSAEDYVHRIGRTARQQATGLAISFVTPADRRYVQDVKKLLGDRLPVTAEIDAMLGHRGRHHGGGRHGSHDNGARTMERGGRPHHRDGYRDRGSRHADDRRPHAAHGRTEATGPARAEGLESHPGRHLREGGGEPNGNVQAPALDRPRRRHRRGGRGRRRA